MICIVPHLLPCKLTSPRCLVLSNSGLAEQQQVEACFIDAGYLLPNYHKFYWMGLATNLEGSRWPNFTWIDRNKAIYIGQYQHWGLYTTRTGSSFEPNNIRAPEDCAGSNLSTTWLAAGGWADQHCRERFSYICEIPPPRPSKPYNASSGYEFRYFSTQMNQSDAQRECNLYGGHLASYSGLQEQVRLTA
jgi:hypothetical protein